MQFNIKKATKQQARLRMALIGPSGSGKTYSALEIATRLGQRVIVIDTERGSASKYADLFAFDVLELETFEPRTYVAALQACTDAGADVVVVDSLSHAWIGKGGALEQVDRAAKRQGGNSFGAWRDVTPQHNELVDAMLRTNAHLIVTMRAKTEFVQERDERTGRTVVRKVGLAPVQRDGLEYEFDVVADVNHEHEAVITKSRCAALSDAIIPRPGESLAKTLRAWLSDGVARDPSPAKEPAPPVEEPSDEHPSQESPAQFGEFYAHVAQIDLPGEAVAVWMKHRGDLAPLPSADREAAWKALCARTEEVGKMKNAKVWLKKAIAEEDARRAERVDPGAALEGAGDPRAETPRQVQESEGVLGSLTDAPDVTELRRRTVSALDAYPALTDSIWTTALGTARRHGCDEATFRRMVDEAMGSDPQPPAGGSGGGAQGGGASARGTGRSVAQSAAPRAANDVETVAARILRQYGTNPFAFPAAVKKHATELSEAEGEQLAAAWAFAGKAPPAQPEAREKLLARARGEVAAWLSEGRMRRAS